MKVSYLSHSLTTDTPSYGNKDEVRLVQKSSISAGDTSNTTDLRLTNNHIGTHLDMPNHFYENGKTITDIDPSEWFFEKVGLIDIECEKGRLINEADFKTHEILVDTDFLIIRTGFEKFRDQDIYWNAYPGISEKACEYLRRNFANLRAVGFDFISLSSPLFKLEGKAAHRVLLDERAGSFILIIEDMKIAHLSKNPSKIIIAPLLLEKGNGGPVTILAL